MAEQENEEVVATTSSPTPVTVVEQENSVEEKTYIPARSFRAYDHGFTNGLLRIEATDFETFAEESERLEVLEQQLQVVGGDIVQVRRLQSSVPLERLRLTQDQLEAESKTNVVQAKLGRARQKLEENHAARQAVHAEKSTLKPVYSWPPVALYLLAGFVFIFADVAVMHDIASNGLDMAGVECWLFSIGLACVAFLLKPAVDRILEKPYAKGERERRNHIALLSFAALALITLGVLGYFRGEATSLDGKKSAITETLSKAQKERTVLLNNSEPTVEKDQLIAQLKGEYATAEEDRASSWSMRLGLILAAILFAVAGAVCLGIAFPAINMLHRSQFVLRNRLRRLTKRLPPLEERVQTLESEEFSQQQAIKTSQFAFAELPALDALTERLTHLLAQELTLLNEQAACRSLRHQSLFRDGKARGQIYELQGQLSYSVSDADRRVTSASEVGRHQGEDADSSSEDNGSASSLRNPGKRPYVVLRRLISQHYTRHRQNGHVESIEIE